MRKPIFILLFLFSSCSSLSLEKISVFKEVYYEFEYYDGFKIIKDTVSSIETDEKLNDFIEVKSKKNESVYHIKSVFIKYKKI